VALPRGVDRARSVMAPTRVEYAGSAPMASPRRFIGKTPTHENVTAATYEKDGYVGATS